MDLAVTRKFLKRVQELDMLFQEMQTLKQQEVGLKLLTSLLKRNETRLGGRFKMKTVIWYNMKDFERLFDMSCHILFMNEPESQINDKFNTCLTQFSISDYDIVKNLEQIVRKLALQFDAVEMTVDYNDENSVLASENDSNDYMMGIDVNYDIKECTDKVEQYEYVATDIPEVHNCAPESHVKHNQKLDDQTQLEFNDSTEVRFDFNKEVSESVNEKLDCAIKQMKEKIDDIYSSYSIPLNDDSKHSITEVKKTTFEYETYDTRDSCAVNFSTLENASHQASRLHATEIDSAMSSRNQDNFIDEEHNHFESIEATNRTQTITQEDYEVNDTHINTVGQFNFNSYLDKHVLNNNDISHETEAKNQLNVETNNSCALKDTDSKHEYMVKEESELIKEEEESQDQVNKKCEELAVTLSLTSNTKNGHFTRPTNKKFKVSNLLTRKKSGKLKKKSLDALENENIDPQLQIRNITNISVNEDNTKTTFRKNKFGCDICGQNFYKESTLARHHRRHEKGEFTILKSGHHGMQNRHVNIPNGFHLDDESSQDTIKTQNTKSSFEIKREYPCNLCEKRLPTKKSVIRHMKVVHNAEISTKDLKSPWLADNTDVRPYRCEVCNLDFTTHQCYIKHTETVKHCTRLGMTDGDRKYLCQLCGKSYLRKDALRRHEKRHTEEKSHMCQFCGYKCRESDNLKRHIALHFESQRNFICEICGAAFHTKKVMEVHHQFKHSEERNYKCDCCGKAFKAKSTLIRHKKVHNQVKENRCWCGSAFKTLYNLRRHMKTAHGSDSKLPSKNFVKTLDCPVKTTVSKTDFLSKTRKQAARNKGDNSNSSEDFLNKGSKLLGYSANNYLRQDLGEDNVQDISGGPETSAVEEQNELHRSEIIPRIPTIESFRHLSNPHQNFDTPEFLKPHAEGSANTDVHVEPDDKVTEPYNQTDSVLPGEGAPYRLQANVPHFSLYGYPPPYSSTVPQFMHMQSLLPPRYEPPIHSPLSYMSYDQLVKIGPAFQTPSHPPSINPIVDTPPVTRSIDVEGVYQINTQPPPSINAIVDTTPTVTKSDDVERVFQINTQPGPSINNIIDTMPTVTRAMDVEGYQHTAPSLSQEQLRVLHHEIYSRLSPEEIAHRLNPDNYQQHSLTQVEDSEIKLKLQQYDQYSNDIPQTSMDNPSNEQQFPAFLPKPGNYSLKQAVVTRFLKKTDELSLGEYNSINVVNSAEYDDVSRPEHQLNKDGYIENASEINSSEIEIDNSQQTVQFDYTDRKNCVYEEKVDETMQVTKYEDKSNIDQSQEDMYDSSIDADYLQSRREMAAESLALMSALTPESTYDGQDLSNQML